MRLLLIDNHSKHIKEILKNFVNTEVVDFKNFKNYKKFDAVILSGGSSLSVKNHSREYYKELALIKSCNKPILGICLGFELINFAFGEDLIRVDSKIKGVMEIKVLNSDKLFNLLPKRFKVFESHRWIVKENKSLKTLAKSYYGIEAVKHPKKEIYGDQFHPEDFIKNDKGVKILKNFDNIVNNS